MMLKVISGGVPGVILRAGSCRMPTITASSQPRRQSTSATSTARATKEKNRTTICFEGATLPNRKHSAYPHRCIMADPVVSVVVPVFNRSQMVGIAIDSSLRSAVPVEVVAVDDASTDDTWEVLRADADPRAAPPRRSEEHTT